MNARLIREENRTRVRHKLLYYLKVTDRQTNQELGRLGDIHIEGMLLFTPEPLLEQAVYDLLLELPKSLAEMEESPELPLQVQALWSRPGPNLGNYYENGLRFLDLSSHTHQVIERLTKIFVMPGRDPGPQIF